MIIGSSNHLQNLSETLQTTFNRKCSINLSTTAKNINQIAIPLVTFITLSSFCIVRADPFTDCIDHCNATTSSGLPRMLCYLICSMI